MLKIFLVLMISNTLPSQMKTPFDLITHTPSGKHRSQRDRNDRTDRQYDCGPSDLQWLMNRMIHQELYGNTEYGNLHEKESCQQRKGPPVISDRKEYFDQCQYDQRNRYPKIHHPFRRIRKNANERNIDTHRNAIQQHHNTPSHIMDQQWRHDHHPQQYAETQHQ